MTEHRPEPHSNTPAAVPPGTGKPCRSSVSVSKIQNKGRRRMNGAQSNKCEMAVGKAGVGPLRSGSAYFELTCSSRVSLSAALSALYVVYAALCHVQNYSTGYPVVSSQSHRMDSATICSVQRKGPNSTVATQSDLPMCDRMSDDRCVNLLSGHDARPTSYVDRAPRQVTTIRLTILRGNW